MKKKITGNLIHKEDLDNGDKLLMFTVSDWNYKIICEELEEKGYTIELNDLKSARTLQQNKYLWALIHEIAELEDGHLSNELVLYGTLLELANAKYEYIRVLDSAVETLRATTGIRALKVVRRVQENGKTFADCKLFIGSSKFDTQEMGRLIDTTLDYAENLGIQTYFYREMLKGK